MCSLYKFFLTIDKKYAGIYNAGFENKSILNIAEIVRNKIPSKIQVYKDKSDPRSYRLNSSKLIKIGFKPKKN